MTKGKIQYDQFAKEASEAGQQSMQAWMTCGNMLMKGAEDYMKTCMTLAQSATEKNTKAMKTLMGSKTINEYTEAQAKIAQQNFDEIMSSATKLTEITVKTCTDAFEPINEQVSQSVKKASESMAA